MKKKNNTVAVVVTYNRKELLKQNIDCLLAQEYPCDIYVIDNASDDGTDKLAKIYKDDSFFYFNTGSNLGGAGGFAYGVRRAVEGGYDYIWMMDDDTLPEPMALSELLKADNILQGEWGWLSSVAYWTDGSICRMNIQKKNIFKHIGEKEYNSKISPIKMCSFVSVLVKADVVKRMGLPISDYFIWTDDYEFTGRISREYPCYVVPSSKVIHAMKKHARVNFARDSEDRIERYQYIYRNDIHCYRQYGLYGWIYIISKDLYTIADVLIHSSGNKKKKIKVIIQGVFMGMKFSPQIEFLSDDLNGAR